MTECIAQIALNFYKRKPVSVSFDAPAISSNGGAILLWQLDDQLHLSAWFAAQIPEEREAAKTRHTRREQVRQRLYQIALGYEDCNDADTLRCDPLLQTVCDRDPQGPHGLSSQPTLLRFENAADMRTIKGLLEQFEQHWVDALAADTEVVVLDIDSTDDPTHGAQQLSFFHGYYDHHIYHPLLIFDGQGQLVSAILRPGNACTARGAGAVLERLIRRIKRRFPNSQIVVRGDAGFGICRLLEQLDRLNAELGGIAYLLGLAKNSVLLRLAEPALKAAAASFIQHRYKVHSENGRLVVTMTAVFSARSAMTWNRNSAPTSASGT